MSGVATLDWGGRVRELAENRDSENSCGGHHGPRNLTGKNP